MNPEERTTQPSFSTGRRWVFALNVVLSAVALLAILVAANYLSAGYFKRFQWTTHGGAELSAQTVNLLDSITNQINVTIFFDPRDEEELYSWTAGLLKEYGVRNPNIKVRTLDYTRFPVEAEALLGRNKLSSLKESNFVLFETEGRTRIVFAKELADLDLAPLLSGQSREVRRTSFKGEMLFTSAIFSIINPKPIKAYFLYGHGEHDPDNNTQMHGYGKFAAVLTSENNIAWAKLSLQQTNEIPADCHLLIIAGPGKAEFLPNETEAIINYLKQGGRMLALLNNAKIGANASMESILTNWGIAVSTGTIIEDKDYVLTAQGDIRAAKLNPEHPITKHLFAEDLPVRLILPRILGQAQSARPTAESPKVDVLAATSDKATDGVQQRTFPLMLAIEQGGIKGVSTERGATRIVVVGDSLFLDNELLDTAANHYFAGMAINWLVGDRNQVLLGGLGPRPVKEYRLVMSKAQMERVRWILLGAMPGAILLLGGLVWLRRRA